jgi:hypothetical protein
MRDFNEVARVEEQKRIAQIRSEERRKSLLQEIRKGTEVYLRDANQMKKRQAEIYDREVNKVHGRLIEEQGYNRDYLPPGVTRNLRAEAQRTVSHQQAQERGTLRKDHEQEVERGVDQAVRADKLERRIEKYAVHRDAWISQHMNTVDQIERAGSDAEKIRYGEVLSTLDSSWARTVERYMDQERDHGLQPEFGRVAHDVGFDRGR